MEITFSLDRYDVWEFNKHVLLHTPRYRARTAATCAAVCLGTFLILLALPRSAEEALIVAAVVGVLSSAVWYFWTKRESTSTNSERPGVLGQHVVGISADGMRWISRVGDSALTWAAITQVADSGRYLYFMCGVNMGLIIPKRAFASPEEARRFFEAASSYWKAASIAVA